MNKQLQSYVLNSILLLPKQQEVTTWEEIGSDTLQKNKMQMANNDTKRHSSSLVVRGTQVEIERRCRDRVAVMKRLRAVGFEEDVAQTQYDHTGEVSEMCTEDKHGQTQ